MVIGTDVYLELPQLQKAVNDARAVSATLEDIGFTVIKGENLTRRQMNQALSKLERAIGPGDQVFFFFAGHGVAIGATNYLIPADMPLPQQGEEGLVRGEAFAVDQIVDQIQASGASTSFVVLDACRDNPFKSNGVRSIGSSRGLADMSASKGVFVLYSAGIGQTALDRMGDDDPNPNSVFTRHLVPLLKTPGLSHVQLAKQVQSQVYRLARKIRHEQQPAYYDQVVGNMYLVEPESKTAISSIANEKSVVVDPVEKFYKQVVGSDSIELLRAFTTRFPESFYSTLIKARIDGLERQKNIAASTKPNSQKTANLEADKPLRKGVFFATDTTRKCDRLAGSPMDTHARARGVSYRLLQKNAKEAIAACEAAIAEFPDDSTTQFQLGRALGAGKQFELAVKWYQKSAEQGIALAQNNLGVLYEGGQGVVQNKALAFKWLKKSADQGLAIAQNSLGRMYSKGYGVTQNNTLAFKWFQKSAAQGFDGGQYLLGWVYLNGVGVTQNKTLAFKWFQKSADQGLDIAQYALGRMYYFGDGVVQNNNLAFRWYQKSAEQGFASAQHNLGLMYSKGEGVTRDDKFAAQIISQSVSQNNSFSINILKQQPQLLSLAFRVEFQRLLTKKGFYSGATDGNFGIDTKRAIDQLASSKN